MDRFDAEHNQAYPIQVMGRQIKAAGRGCFFNIKINLRENEVNQMKEIFEQYGSVIIAAVAISALVA
ncbi:hypothetical protein, partial [Lacrimispora sp. 38-1]|uniref:hypothetical protein n=1 Tax=Lacrimispora sp. 38-1 TaxID=3125778 RepID=UPI003CF17F49